MARLVQLGGVQAQAETCSDGGIELGAVCEGQDAPVVELSLREAERVELVLGRGFETAGLLAGHVITGLDAHLGRGVDFLVEGSGDDVEVLHGGDVGAVGGRLVAKGERVLGDGGFLDIVASFTTDEETFMSGGDVHNGVNIAGGGNVVEEGTGVDVGVLEGEGEFLDGGAVFGRVVELLEIRLDAVGEDVGQLDLGVEQGGGVVGAVHHDTCAPVGQRHVMSCAFAVGHSGDCEEQLVVLGAGEASGEGGVLGEFSLCAACRG